MKPRRNYTFNSSLTPAIEGLIQEKRASGYMYNSNADVLKDLDTFCIEQGFISDTVTKDLSDAWAVQRQTEGISSRNIRVSNLRQVSKYLLSIGVESYMPKMLQSTETKVAHVFTAQERKEFFECLNKLDIKRKSRRLLEECRVLFRLYYCCGLRLSEPLWLTWDDIDYDSGRITILQSKGYKDRVVWVSSDIAEMIRKYHKYITTECPGEALVFPGTKNGKPVNEVTVRAYFQRTLAMTSYASIGNLPTIKSFRHTFVVDRLNAWMENGESIEDKLPYLSKYLGHNSKLGLQYRYQQGKVQVNHNRFMGYTKDEEGNLIIVPEEAEIIKRIYREYLEGKSLVGIGRDLEKDGILTAAGKPRWRPETIKKILLNEKYIGDALLQKTFTVDFLTKKRVKNEGHVPQYYVENSHEAIIPKELFLQAQEELHRRSNIYTGADKNKRIYSSKYALSTITFCGDCGDIYRRVYWNIHGRKEFVWRCVTRIEQGPEVCKNRTVKEAELYDAVMTAINRLLAGGDNMIRILEENIHAVIGETTEYKISEINTLLEEKQKELIILANKGKDFESLADEIEELREKRQTLLVEDASLSGENERINELIEFIRTNKYRTLLYDDTLVRKIIQNVTVYDDHFVICFKSGIEIKV